VELVKLKQGAREEVVIIGVDCFGAFKNTDYFRYINDNPAEMTKKFIEDSISGNADENLSAACRSCEFPVPEGADILVGLLGMDIGKELMAQSLTPEGESLLESMGLPGMDVPAGRAGAVDQLVATRKQYRDEMFARTKEATDTIEKMNEYLAHCVNCYNCRVACPVCYCKECVFVTDVFNHEPSQYLKWAFRKGALKMPTDTVFYHITRLAHMSTACVGCGQCSNACPNDIPVMELFRLVSQGTQKAFDYEAGRSIEEKPPLSEFREDEFKEVVGIH
jgi:formate dehydrogenase subunit beta